MPVTASKFKRIMSDPDQSFGRERGKEGGEIQYLKKSL